MKRDWEIHKLFYYMNTGENVLLYKYITVFVMNDTYIRNLRSAELYNL